MVKKLLFDRNNFACRGDAWIADGEAAYYIFYSYFSHTTETPEIRLATSRDGER